MASGCEQRFTSHTKGPSAAGEEAGPVGQWPYCQAFLCFCFQASRKSSRPWAHPTPVLAGGGPLWARIHRSLTAAGSTGSPKSSSMLLCPGQRPAPGQQGPQAPPTRTVPGAGAAHWAVGWKPSASPPLHCRRSRPLSGLLVTAAELDSSVFESKSSASRGPLGFAGYPGLWRASCPDRAWRSLGSLASPVLTLEEDPKPCLCRNSQGSPSSIGSPGILKVSYCGGSVGDASRRSEKACSVALFLEHALLKGRGVLAQVPGASV